MLEWLWLVWHCAASGRRRALLRRRMRLAVLVLTVDRSHRLHVGLWAELLLIVLLRLHAWLLRVLRGGKGVSLGYTRTRLLRREWMLLRREWLGLRHKGLLLRARSEGRLLLLVSLSRNCLRVWW